MATADPDSGIEMEYLPDDMGHVYNVMYMSMHTVMRMKPRMYMSCTLNVNIYINMNPPKGKLNPMFRKSWCLASSHNIT